MHPTDAEDRGINGGDSVKVFNDRGSFVGSALISGDTMKGVVASYLGHWASDSTSKSAVNSISSDRTSNMGMAPTYSDNLVEVAKLAGDRNVGDQSVHAAA
jgi:anaerobic selenocysteine-containing dehydrogenase